MISFVEYSLFYTALLQKRPIIVRSLLIEATPYLQKGIYRIYTEISLISIYHDSRETSLISIHVQRYISDNYTCYQYDSFLYMCREISLIIIDDIYRKRYTMFIQKDIYGIYTEISLISI